MVRKVILVLADLVLVQNCFAQRDTAVIEENQRARIGRTDTTLVAPSYLFSPAVHEFEHFSLTVRGTADSVRIGLQNALSFGLTDWNGNPLGIWAPLAGWSNLHFIRHPAERNDSLELDNNLSHWAHRYVPMMLFESRIDFQKHMLQDINHEFFNFQSADIDEFVAYVTGPKTRSQNLTYSVHLARSIFDHSFDWDGITQNWEILKGWPHGKVWVSPYSLLIFHPYWGNSAIGVNADVKW